MTQQSRLKSVVEHGTSCMKLKAQERKTRRDRSASVEDLLAGSKVLLRKMGRNKTGDVWESMPNKVFDKVGDSNAYMVVPLYGAGKVKTG